MSKALFKVKIRVFIIASLFLIWPLFSSAGDYDYYVDFSASSGGDGSKNKPFKNIAEAVEKGGSIFIEDGDYEEDLELKKGTKLFGESEGGVVIAGEIKMGDKTALKDLTVRDANETVVIKADADAEIDNCTITNFNKIGINALAGGGKLKVVNSKIRKAKGKGFYIQRGKEIELINNEVTDNENEEGIDLRSKISGVIRGNFIVGNGESGIEVIIGSADLIIEDNIIKRNGSSGIASQFYPDPGLNKKGKIKIKNNKIEDNDKYGLDCNMPQGGSPSEDYWRDSLDLEGNSISGNKLKAIDDYCKLIKAVEENEEADNSISNSNQNKIQLEKTEPELTEEEKETIEREKELEKQRRENVLKETEDLLKKNEELGLIVENQIIKIEKTGRIKKFFLGINQEKIDSLKSSLAIKSQQIQQTKNLLERIDWEEEKKQVFEENLNKIEEQFEERQVFLDQRTQSFGIWGWLKNLF